MSLVRRSIASFLGGTLLAASITGCGPTTKGTDTGGDKGGVSVRPDDKPVVLVPQHLGIVLGTDSNGGSTELELLTAEREVTVDSMWVRTSTPAEGGSSPVNLKVGLNDSGKVKVGIYEEHAGGLGPNWRAGVWLASFVSSQTLNKDLTDFVFTAEAGGFVDGASASGLMSAGMLAAMLGVEVDAKATMTGIINPDGTIGPVGGIPHKFEGSIAKGKTKLGYPVGLRYAVDMNTNENVDLQKLAQSKGAQAVEVSDVYGAYELMTGQKLPRPVPVEAGEMALEDVVNDKFDEKYAAWLGNVQKEWNRILELHSMGRLPQTLVNLANLAQEEAGQAEKYKSQGFAPTAYKHMVNAWIYAASATSTSDILEALVAGDTAGAKSQLQDLAALVSTTEPTLRKVGNMKPTTMGGHLQMLSAYDRAIAGLAAHVHSQDTMQRALYVVDMAAQMTPEQLAEYDMATQIVEYTAPAVIAVARAVAHTLQATEGMEIEGVQSLDYMCSLPNVKRLATSFQSAATANVNYFETLVGVKDDQTRMMVQSMEPDYLTSWIAVNISQQGAGLKDEWGEDTLAWGLMALSAAQMAYFKTSSLISKWYSLGVQNDWMTGRPTAVQHDRAFMNMMTTAERKARENAHSAKVATGSIPVQARIAYQQAIVLREGDLADKLTALELFWQASAYSQTAVMLARNPPGERKNFK